MLKISKLLILFLLVQFSASYSQETFKVLEEKHNENYRMESGDLQQYLGSNGDTMFFSRPIYKLMQYYQWFYGYGRIDMIHRKTGALINKIEFDKKVGDQTSFVNGVIKKERSFIVMYNRVDYRERKHTAEFKEYDFNGKAMGLSKTIATSTFKEKPLYNYYFRKIDNEHIALVETPVDPSLDIKYSVLDSKLNTVQTINAKTDKPVYIVRFNGEHLFLLSRNDKTDKENSVSKIFNNQNIPGRINQQNSFVTGDKRVRIKLLV